MTTLCVCVCVGVRVGAGIADPTGRAVQVEGRGSPPSKDRTSGTERWICVSLNGEGTGGSGRAVEGRRALLLFLLIVNQGSPRVAGVWAREGGLVCVFPTAHDITEDVPGFVQGWSLSDEEKTRAPFS